MDTMSTNVLGPALTVQKFMPLLERAENRRVVMNMSSGLGSLAQANSPGWAVYSISKAAIGMLVRGASAQFHLFYPGSGVSL
jgi:NAD(P)-dependent dehydrogenase (short-subunit alcohol dehydrogenase family)